MYCTLKILILQPSSPAKQQFHICMHETLCRCIFFGLRSIFFLVGQVTSCSWLKHRSNSQWKQLKNESPLQKVITYHPNCWKFSEICNTCYCRNMTSWGEVGLYCGFTSCLIAGCFVLYLFEDLFFLHSVKLLIYDMMIQQITGNTVSTAAVAEVYLLICLCVLECPISLRPVCVCVGMKLLVAPYLLFTQRPAFRHVCVFAD